MMARIGLSFSLLFLSLFLSGQVVFLKVISRSDFEIEFQVNKPPEIYKLSSHLDNLLAQEFEDECAFMTRIRDLLIELSLHPGASVEWKYYSESIKQINKDLKQYCHGNN